MISGVWGHVTNKHLAGIPGTGFLLNTQSYVRLHCLPASVIGQNRRKLTPDTPKGGYIRAVLDSGYKFESVI